MFSKISPGIVGLKVFQLSFQFSCLKASFLMEIVIWFNIHLHNSLFCHYRPRTHNILCRIGLFAIWGGAGGGGAYAGEQVPKQCNSYQFTWSCLCFGSPTAQLAPVPYCVTGSCNGPIVLFIDQNCSFIYTRLFEKLKARIHKV